ncbi:MAG: electron transport complex subunit RsxG [Sulfuriflexus sp.]|nr:electron transport complex subunit RsxG [Sulfuriflexus sp.]
MIRTAALLGAFALISTWLVAITFDVTEAPIAASEKKALLRNLHELIPAGIHNNDLFTDVISVQDSSLLGLNKPQRVFRARLDEKPVALAIESVAPDGYSGNIFLLIAIRYDGSLLGVRVSKHKETPGLGDAIEIKRSDWITTFNNKSLSNPITKAWRVQKDGGEFDQFTGATITPRAIVKAVHRTLQYYQQHRDSLFADNSERGS